MTPDPEQLSELLKAKKEPDDPSLMKLVLLLANKVIDQRKDKYDEEGNLLVRNVNF